MREAKFQKLLSIAIPTEIYDYVKKVTENLKISLGEWFREAALLKIQQDKKKNKEE